MSVSAKLKKILKNPISESTNGEIYKALVEMIKDISEESSAPKGKKKLYYISAEFLLGKLLASNLINLGLYDETKNLLEQNGKSLDAIEEMEPEPSLGNGGLGRLAACFLDSVASVGLPGDGIGLCYHMGLFRQVFENNFQTEHPNPWMEPGGFLTNKQKGYKITFKNFDIVSNLYEIDIIGAGGRVNKLHLFDAKSTDASIIHSGIEYSKEDVKKNITLFLYPDDSDDKGRYLRIYQEYFMVSNAARLILEECTAKGCNLHDLPDYAVIQINDTHPSLIIPELIRLLTERGVEMDEAIDIVSKTCAYTNHTILAEALEKWPYAFLKDTVPHLLPIIEVLDNKVRRKYPDSSVYIIDKNDTVHMAHMDIHYGFSVNGVASLHTEILKNSELNNFYKLYPEKFNNKTNGITFRRWLTCSNPELYSYIKSLIGDKFEKDASELSKLLEFKNDETVLSRLEEIKHNNKCRLKTYLMEKSRIMINENSIFDVQIKRLHEYKRQQMNILYCIHKYLEIKKGKKPQTPITVIFGAKAAPAYTVAKDIIHLILSLSKMIDADKDVCGHLKIVMVENYNVTYAQHIIPASDISEQISLASKEASGTGNMKLMLNGAITLGTEDGANVEIHKLVGDENIYIFGSESDEVIKRYKDGTYNPKKYYEESEMIKSAVDFITDQRLLKHGDKKCLERLKNELLTKDWFMTFPDFEDYVATKEKAFEDYKNKKLWNRKMLVNIAKAGYFSSDRTVLEYNDCIWKLKGE